VHEVYSAEKFKTRTPEWQKYHAAFHTSTVELAALAGKARPKLLVLYHQLYWGATDADLLKEIAGTAIAGLDPLPGSGLGALHVHNIGKGLAGV
jgi:ribonuclease BN (tRNA processing enzyme)